MGLLDKIKDLFMDDVTEDEEMDVLEEGTEQYTEPKYELPKVMRDTIDKEEKIELKVKPDEFIQREKKEPEKEKPVDNGRKFNFPIDFDDELPSRNGSSKPTQNVLRLEKEKEKEKEVTKRVSELYPKKEEVKVKPKFKATPVISPVYGILDKNYKKEEVKEKAEDTVEMRRPSKKVDFETVRKKAFGNLVDEIKDNLMCENCELYREVKKISALNEDDLLYDMTVDDDKKEVTIEKAYDDYEEFGVAYEPKIVNSTSEDDVKNSQVDSSSQVKEAENEKNDEFEKIDQMINESSKEKEEEENPIKDIPSRENKRENKKDDKVDEDFFDLIDSMYKERVDE